MNFHTTFASYVRLLQEQGHRYVGLSKQAREGFQAMLPVGSSPAKKEGRLRETPQMPKAWQGRSAEVSGGPSLSVTHATSQSRQKKLANLKAQVQECVQCTALAKTRTQIVFGVGNPEAKLMLVGEAPGVEEDRQGEPFVGPAGQLLTKILAAMGLQREEVYIANILKCRPNMPPGAWGNRKPTGEEMATCLPYLLAQIEIIQPQVLVALGSTAIEGLLHPGQGISRLRGRWMSFQGIPTMPTFHPSYLLRDQGTSTEKRKVWEDMMQVMEKLALPISEKQRGYFLPKS